MHNKIAFIGAVVLALFHEHVPSLIIGILVLSMIVLGAAKTHNEKLREWATMKNTTELWEKFQTMDENDEDYTTVSEFFDYYGFDPQIKFVDKGVPLVLSDAIYYLESRLPKARVLLANKKQIEDRATDEIVDLL